MRCTSDARMTRLGLIKIQNWKDPEVWIFGRYSNWRQKQSTDGYNLNRSLNH